ncbi:MAG: hypothetical protein JO266_04440 [Acidobacteria bacterium]|nr:hypothetical protein [Acidobacteriota bacterium]
MEVWLFGGLCQQFQVGQCAWPYVAVLLANGAEVRMQEQNTMVVLGDWAKYPKIVHVGEVLIPVLRECRREAIRDVPEANGTS